MTTAERRKLEKVQAMNTEALEHILSHLAGPEIPTADSPLAGLVHIDGIGQVSVKTLRAELRRRQGGES